MAPNSPTRNRPTKDRTLAVEVVMSRKIPPEFIVRIAIKNDAGRLVGHREFVTYQGLLAMAHDQGLSAIETELLQAPSDANGRTAIVRATTRGKPGAFTGLGDASPENTSRKVVRHLLRVAETRAKARALRDMTNVAMVAFEELGGDDESDDAVVAQHVRATTQPTPRQEPSATEAQRRALLAKAHALGHADGAAGAFLRARLGCELDRASKGRASRVLTALDEEFAALRPRARTSQAAE